MFAVNSLVDAPRPHPGPAGEPAASIGCAGLGKGLGRWQRDPAPFSQCICHEGARNERQFSPESRQIATATERKYEQAQQRAANGSAKPTRSI